MRRSTPNPCRLFLIYLRRFIIYIYKKKDFTWRGSWGAQWPVVNFVWIFVLVTAWLGRGLCPRVCQLVRFSHQGILRTGLSLSKYHVRGDPSLGKMLWRLFLISVWVSLKLWGVLPEAWSSRCCLNIRDRRTPCTRWATLRWKTLGGGDFRMCYPEIHPAWIPC